MLTDGESFPPQGPLAAIGISRRVHSLENASLMNASALIR